jgi:hypothetical protein
MMEKPKKPTGKITARFEVIDLSFNIAAIGINDPGSLMDCNPGGSVICLPGSNGCGGGGRTCVGSSCSGSSATRDLSFDSRIRINPAELEKLQAEVMAVVKKFAK